MDQEQSPPYNYTRSLSQVLKSLSNGILTHSANFPNTPPKFSADDLINASLIFMHVLGDLSYTHYQRQDLTLEQAGDQAETLGKTLRQLILDHTAIDLHNTIKGNN